MIEDLEFNLKVIIVGNGRIGKTSMITRFVKGTYSDEYKKTLGVAFLEKRYYVNAAGMEVTFLLWDTAGQEEYDELTKEYYKGSSACILAFSTTDRDSFNAVEKWNQKVTEQCGVIPTAIVQTKIDMMSKEAKVTEDEASALASRLNMKLFKTSTKENINVKDAFEYLVGLYIKYKNNSSFSPQNPLMTMGEIKSKSKDPSTEASSKSDKGSHGKGDQKERGDDEEEAEEGEGGKKKKKDKCRIF